MNFSDEHVLAAIHRNAAKAEEIIYRARAYREFSGDPVGYMDAHEYEPLGEGIGQYNTSKECYNHIGRLFGAAADFVLENICI